MDGVYKELNSIINAFYSKYKDVNEEIASKRSGNGQANGKWTLKEILGHLIDSASNNHQRFVRLQIADELIFPGYGKDNVKWLKIEKYNELDFSDVILLWKQYNILIGNIIKRVDESKLENYWEKPDGDKITLKDLMIDYVRHLKEHIKHFEQTLAEING